MSSIIKKVERFIQRLDDMDYVLTIEAHKMWYTTPSAFPSLIGERNTLSDYLANAISAYQENRDNEEKKLSYAKRCLIWINRAFACGVVQEGKRLISKNKKLERDVKRLQELLDECNKKCQTLEQENKELHRRFPDSGFTGDVLSG